MSFRDALDMNFVIFCYKLYHEEPRCPLANPLDTVIVSMSSKGLCQIVTSLANLNLCCSFMHFFDRLFTPKLPLKVDVYMIITDQ